MVVLTVSVCWGHSEQEGLCQLHFHSLLWELCKVGWKILANNLLVSSSLCARQLLSSYCSHCAALLEMNLLLL